MTQHMNPLSLPFLSIFDELPSAVPCHGNSWLAAIAPAVNMDESLFPWTPRPLHTKHWDGFGFDICVISPGGAWLLSAQWGRDYSVLLFHS
jgi:hypothetical protein